MLPFEDIPDDLVPLTAHLKELLNCATTQMVGWRLTEFQTEIYLKPVEYIS